MDKAEIMRKAQNYLEQETEPGFRDEVTALLKKEDWDELGDRFYTDLAFGTGGLRGVIGGGFNRMNPFVVRRATQGLANYVQKEGATAPDGSRRAVIAYDSRRYSSTFALEAALVFAANGIKTYLFSSLRPTPELSFAVRQLSAATGIVVTASHNPPEYNGYKVYWGDGAQIVAPHDKAIIKEVQGVSGHIKTLTKEDALEKDLLEYIDTEIDEKFVAMAKSVSIHPDLLRERGKELKIVYTPLHGTGAFMVERVMGDLGIDVITVPEQREPDGEFPTVEFPNPEEASAMKMAVELGRREKADLVIGTDPDADRIGIAVPDGDDLRLITGNQLGALLADYMYSQRKGAGTLPDRPAFVKTIVTTELQRKIVEKYGVSCFDTLTGFKHIAALVRKWEGMPDGPNYIMGDEESYGYMIGTDVRDKDSISAALLTAEMALYHVSQGKSVVDRLNELYREFGYYEESTISKYFRGQAGIGIMTGLMERLRKNPPAKVGGIDVVEIRDVQEGTTRYLPSGKVEKNIDLPVSNVLQFILSDESVVSARPSGTEPKIKFYASCPSAPGMELDAAHTEVGGKIKKITADIESWLSEAEG